MEQKQDSAFDRKARDEARERDRNGALRSISLSRDRSGAAHLTLYYGGGKVTHYLPARIVEHLAIEIDAFRSPVAAAAAGSEATNVVA